jgi:hypothetical protein
MADWRGLLGEGLGRGGKGLAFALAVGVPLHEWLRAQVQLCDACVERVNLHRTLIRGKIKQRKKKPKKKKEARRRKSSRWVWSEQRNAHTQRHTEAEDPK